MSIVFFRIDEPVTIKSENLFIQGKTIVLSHKENRKRLVLNILVDGLSWGQLKKKDLSLLPNIVKFFKKGIIFNHNYSVAEYTYPSLATIETGLYPHHSQIFHPSGYVRLDDCHKTLSEKMNALGYYCVNVMSDGEGIFNEVTRGYDRLIVNHFFNNQSHIAVNRAIKHMDAFSACDQFINLHVMDVHPYDADIQIDLPSQIKVSLAERLGGQEQGKSVSLSCNVLNMFKYQKALENLDRNLGVLFSYIEKNYDEGDFVVSLYSDHGVSIFTEQQYLLSEEHSCSTLMCRGNGVPECGIVNDAVTSSMDVYSILGHLAGYAVDEAEVDSRLPKIFGGMGREYVISNSLYPGQTYKLCIRTFEHEFRLETIDVTTEDGRINMDTYVCQIFSRNEAHIEIEDETLRDYFLAIAFAHTRTLHDPDYHEKVADEFESN